MKKLQLLPVGNPDTCLLEWLRQALAELAEEGVVQLFQF